MKIKGEPRAFLSNEARQLLNLYESLGERAEIFLPRHIYDNLTSFVKLCFEEPDDPTAHLKLLSISFIPFDIVLSDSYDFATILRINLLKSSRLLKKPQKNQKKP